MVAQEKALWELEKVSLHRRGDYKICYWILTFKIHFPLFSSSPDLHWPFLHVLCEGRAEHLECSWELKAKLTRPSSWDSSCNEGLRHRTCVIEIAVRVKVSYLRQGQLWHSWVFWGKPARSLASSGLGPHVVIWGPAFFQWRGSARPPSGLTEKEKTKEDLNFSLLSSLLPPQHLGPARGILPGLRASNRLCQEPDLSPNPEAGSACAPGDGMVVSSPSHLQEARPGRGWED